MEGRRGFAVVSAIDRVYLRRACELAARGRGSTLPNPAVGAVIVDGATTLGEGFHRVRGEAHAEVEAFRDARERGNDPRGATLYVTLEPCDHTGLTPPCSQAVIDAGIVRVVVGALDPIAAHAGGVARLRDAGVTVDLADDLWSRELIEDFTIASNASRPYVRLKLAASLDGRMAPRPGVQHWLTGSEARAYVRELRAASDAVLVGAGTVRIDDPQLSVRPPRARRKPYVRVVVCEQDTVPLNRAIFAPIEGYDRTIVLAPAGVRERFMEIASVADVVFVGDESAVQLDLTLAFRALRERGIASVLCEGGPTLAGRMLEAGLVDRIDWLLAPSLLAGPDAVPAIAGGPSGLDLRFDKVERLGPDVLISAVVA